MYMSIVAVAIVLSFHLRKTASDIELRMAKPLGAIFWVLSVSCLGVGIANYTSTCSPPFFATPLLLKGWGVVDGSVEGANFTLW
jgi:hypothetical protein